MSKLRIGKQPVSGIFGQHGSFKKMFVGLKYVKKMELHFDPFDPLTRSTREFLRTVRAPIWKKTNPACEIKHRLLTTRSPVPPQIHITYVNGFTHRFKASTKPREIEQRMKFMSAYLEGHGIAAGHEVEEVDDLD